MPKETTPSVAEQADLIERLKLEAQIHAQEARTANATIAEIYRIVTGGTGEPGNWHGAEPVRAYVHRVQSLFTAIAHGDEMHREWLKEAIECHLAGYPVPTVRAALTASQAASHSAPVESKACASVGVESNDAQIDAITQEKTMHTIAEDFEHFLAYTSNVPAGERLRLAYEHGDYRGRGRAKHKSDCAVHNEPAYPAGPCDCEAGS